MVDLRLRSFVKSANTAETFIQVESVEAGFGIIHKAEIYQIYQHATKIFQFIQNNSSDTAHLKVL